MSRSHRFRAATVLVSDKFLSTVAAPIIRRTVAKVVVPVTVAAIASVASVKISNATTTSIVQTMTVFEILPIASVSMVAAKVVL